MIAAGPPRRRGATGGSERVTAVGTANRVLFERRGAVGWVTFNRPEAHNAMTFEMWDRLSSICDEVEADPDIRVLVLTGAGEKA
jgi:enoyl-CoA hydratase/carnithine racemase